MNILDIKNPRELNEMYNSEQGLGLVCTTLHGMHEAMQVRAAIHKRKLIPLDGFVVAKTWIFDKDGSLHRFNPGFNIGDVPFVVSTKDLHREDTKYTDNFFDYFYDDILKGEMNKLPPIDGVCPVCGKGWGMKNNYDSVSKAYSHDVKMGRPADNMFVGKTYGSVKTLLEGKSNNARDVSISRLNDLMVVNPDYVVGHGDYCLRTVKKSYHPDCMNFMQQMLPLFFESFKDGKATLRKDFKDPATFVRLIKEAGYAPKSILPCTDSCIRKYTEHWYTIETNHATFTFAMANDLFHIVVQDAEELDLEMIGLNNFNQGCEIEGKMFIAQTYEEARKGLMDIRFHLEKYQKTFKG